MVNFAAEIGVSVLRTRIPWQVVLTVDGPPDTISGERLWRTVEIHASPLVYLFSYVSQ